MSHASKIIIEETEKELLIAYNKQKDSRVKLRIKALLLFKKGKFKKQEDLAAHLCIGYSTLRLWLRKYSNEGFNSFIKVPLRGKPQCFVTADIHPGPGCQT